MRSSTSFIAFKSILCAVDFSYHSANALRYAAALTRVNDAGLTVVYVVDPVVSAAASAAHNPRASARSARAELHRFVRTTLRPARVPPVRVIVAIGEPAQCVMNTADRVGADIVAVGTHGLTGLKKAFFGSTTEAILRRSRLPVLVVPRTRRPTHEWPAGLIVAAVDLADSVTAEAAVAAAIAKSCGGTLTVVHAIPVMRLPIWLRLNKRAIDRTRITLARDWLNAKLKRSGVDADVQVILGEMAEATAAFAARRGASMLVFIRPGSGPIGRLFEAGSEYRLVHHARCPVLVRHLQTRRPAGRQRRLTSRLRPVA